MFNFDLPDVTTSRISESRWYCANLVYEIYNSSGYILFTEPSSIVPADFSASLNFYPVDLGIV